MPVSCFYPTVSYICRGDLDVTAVTAITVDNSLLKLARGWAYLRNPTPCGSVAYTYTFNSVDLSPPLGNGKTPLQVWYSNYLIIHP